MISSDIPFHISTFSESGSCVEVGRTGGRIDVRNSNDRVAGTSSFTREEWAAFIKGVKAGEFDRYAE